MARLRFGTFLAPHHPIGESPTLQWQRDLELAEHLDKLDFDEFWVGEHHSSGWETLASPEMFLVAAAERTRTIKLGTGVISLPYHHPWNVANRLVFLDHLSRGRVIFGSGPGALPSDAHTMGIDPMTQRNRQDEALGAIIRLLRGEERFTMETDWFTLRDAQLQVLPYQEDMPMVTASSISPSGMTLAGKHGTGVISVASTSSEGLNALPNQWKFAEDAAAKAGQTVDRKDWRVLMSWHIAETREQAIAESRLGLQRWHNDYNVKVLGRPGASRFEDPDELVNVTIGDGASGTGTGVIGTPDDLVAAIRNLQEVVGGFGVVLGFAHDWANPEATKRSWDLVARYVVPELNGTFRNLQGSADFLVANQAELMGGAGRAIISAITQHEGASSLLAATMQQNAKEAESGGFRPGVAITEDASA